MATSLTWEADPSNEHAKGKLSIITPALWFNIFCNYKTNSNSERKLPLWIWRLLNNLNQMLIVPIISFVKLFVSLFHHPHRFRAGLSTQLWSGTVFTDFYHSYQHLSVISLVHTLYSSVPKVKIIFKMSLVLLHIKQPFFKKLFWRHFLSNFDKMFTTKQRIWKSLLVY